MRRDTEIKNIIFHPESRSRIQHCTKQVQGFSTYPSRYLPDAGCFRGVTIVAIFVLQRFLVKLRANHRAALRAEIRIRLP